MQVRQLNIIGVGIAFLFRIALNERSGGVIRELWLRELQMSQGSWTVILKWVRRVALTTLAVLAVVSMIIIASPQGRAAMKTVLFISQVTPTIPVKPQQWFTRAPSVEEINFPRADGLGSADLYRPAGTGTHGAGLLFFGVNPAGRDEPRVVNLAEGLARSGTIVMIPWSETMTKKKVSASEIDFLTSAYEYLTSLERVDPDRSGMGGFCVGASLAMVAAQDERIRERVQFVNFFGGYYDATDLAASVVSKSRFYGDRVEAWSPDALSVEVVASHLIDGLSDAEERSVLKRVFVERTAIVHEDALATMSAEARTVHRILSGASYREVERLISELPSSMRSKLDAISPATRIEDLRARVLIMHDREDKLVPSEESRRLADALRERGDVYHTEFSLFQHVDPTRPVSPPIYVRELFKLYLHMYNVLREMD